MRNICEPCPRRESPSHLRSHVRLVAICGLALLFGLHMQYVDPSPGSNELTRLLAPEAHNSTTFLVMISVARDSEEGSSKSCARRDSDSVYWYSREQSLVDLSSRARIDLNVPTVCARLGRKKLGGPWLFRAAAGSDAVVANGLLATFGNVGRIRIEGSRDAYDLSRCEDSATKRMRRARPFGKYWILFKVNVLVKTLFLIFCTSTLASYTLRETQARMLRFTYLIKERVGNRESYNTLVTDHILDVVVFAPITLGMLSFLYDFFFDQLLALLILTLIWGCEVFAAISLRSAAAISTVPHLICLYLAALHVYIFAFPIGFHYVAFATTVAAIGHVMFYFWNHCEIPALLAGLVSPSTPRALDDH